MKKNLISIAVAATLGFTAFAVSAEEVTYENGYTAEHMYRGAWYALPGLSIMGTDSDLEAENGVGGFIKAGKELSEKWDIQLGVGYNEASDDFNVSGANGHYKQTTVGLDALYMFSRGKFRPFLLAGGGYARNDLDYSVSAASGYRLDDGVKNSWMGNVGAGAQYLFNDKFGMQVDVRQQWSDAQLKLRDAAGNKVASTDGSISNTILSIGGIFRFGAPVVVPVVAAVVAEPAPAPAPAPAPEPAPAPAPACVPTFETVTVSAEKLFGFDKFKLQEGSKPILDEVAAKLKAHPEFQLVMVTGHTDRIGSAEYNQKLSLKRANQVKEYLVSQGVEASRLEAVGKGESEPVAACDGVKGKKLIECLEPNRRVIISSSKEHEVNSCK